MAIITTSTKTEVLVDDDLTPFLSLFSWYDHSEGYVSGTICGHLTLMHRLITNARPRYVVDHLNRNRRDNRRDNLRVCLFGENMCNTKTRGKYRGVVRDNRDGKWCARITINGKIYSFAYGTDPEASARAWDIAARYHYGEFAVTNFAGTEAKPAWELITAVRNCENRTSRFRGVRRTKGGRWQVIFFKKHYGVFATQEEAARAYDAAAFDSLGDKAILNFRHKAGNAQEQ